MDKAETPKVSTKSGWLKTGSIDKYDAHIPNGPNTFINDCHLVSPYVGTNFSSPCTWGYRDGDSRSHKIGTQIKVFYASGMGYTVDGLFIGKSSQL